MGCADSWSFCPMRCSARAFIFIHILTILISEKHVFSRLIDERRLLRARWGKWAMHIASKVNGLVAHAESQSL